MADDKERKEPHLTAAALARRARRERRLGDALRDNLRRRRRQKRAPGGKDDKEGPARPA